MKPSRLHLLATCRSRYQWQVSPNSSGSGAVNIAGATNSTLVLNNVQATNSGYYSLQATNTISPYIANSTWLQLTVQPLSALLQLQLMATNYDPGNGVWTDSSGNGNNATYSGDSTPTLVASVTPNGSTAVNISSGTNSFALTSSLDPSSGYTVFAYLLPSNTSGRHAITGGSAANALEYDIYNGNQNYLNEYSGVEQASGAATISTSSFSLVDLAVNASGVAFRLNGATDGTAAGATFSQPITRIGNNEGLGDGLVGEVAEIDIYNGVLTSNQVNAVEAQLTANYVTIGVATNPTNITATVSGSVLQLSWPADHLGWRLLVQTNDLAQGISANTNDWTTVPGSASIYQTNITINPAMPTEFYRLVYP